MKAIRRLRNAFGLRLAAAFLARSNDARRDLTLSAFVITPAGRDMFESLVTVGENGGGAC